LLLFFFLSIYKTIHFTLLLIFSAQMAEVSGHVAFSASVTTGTTIAASNDSSVPFHTILLNAGNAYNGCTGIFTCPQEGDYVFMLNANVGHYFDTLQIHKNGQVVATAGRRLRPIRHFARGPRHPHPSAW
jgi:hypothetical protein